jgi:DNA-directed RNA polymerase specialized sigma24 family protein
MRRMRRGLEGMVLTLYGRILEVYTPYVFVRCARYTNGRRQAQQIGAYTLINACLIAGELGDAVPVGRMVETVLHVVGPDVLAGARGEDWRRGYDEPLIVDRRIREIARAVNSLAWSTREALVLRHVSGVELPDLARLLGQPAGMVRAQIGRGERLLAKRLAGLPGTGRVTTSPDVRALLAEFATGLDGGWIQEVGAGALDYLVTNGRWHRRQRCRHRGRN